MQPGVSVPAGECTPEVYRIRSIQLLVRGYTAVGHSRRIVWIPVAFHILCYKVAYPSSLYTRMQG